MAYVIADPCIAVCDTACVDVCPCDCIHGPVPKQDLERVAPGERERVFGRVQLYIDAATCIDCGLCESRCPVGAIFPGDALPEQWKAATRRSEDFFREHPELSR